MKLSYLNALKAFIEGERDLQEWPQWWQENSLLIEKTEGRTRYLKIKLNCREGTRQILEYHSVKYKLNGSINWNRCKVCGQPLFDAVPRETTKDQIKEFARNSNLPDKEEIEHNEWIHPGIYCPNGCTEVLTSHSRENE